MNRSNYLTSAPPSENRPPTAANPTAREVDNNTLVLVRVAITHNKYRFSQKPVFFYVLVGINTALRFFEKQIDDSCVGKMF